jgi:hypothetical protein
MTTALIDFYSLSQCLGIPIFRHSNISGYQHFGSPAPQRQPESLPGVRAQDTMACFSALGEFSQTNGSSILMQWDNCYETSNLS